MIESAAKDIIEKKLDYMLSGVTCPPCVRLKQEWKDRDDLFVYTYDDPGHTKEEYQTLEALMSNIPMAVPTLMKYNEDTKKWDNYGNPKHPQKVQPQVIHARDAIDIRSAIMNLEKNTNLIHKKYKYLVVLKSKDTKFNAKLGDITYEMWNGKELLENIGDIIGFWEA